MRHPKHGSKWIRRSTRFAIYHRDGFVCVACGFGVEDRMLTLDHIKACNQGGTNDPANLVTMCHPCNSSKGDKTIRQWVADLKHPPSVAAAMLQRIRRRTRRPLDRAEGRRLSRLQGDEE